MSTYSTTTTKNNLRIDVIDDIDDDIAEARASLALVHMIDDWHCPCGRTLRPTDVEVTCEGLRIVCAGCHKSLLDVELP